MSEINHQKQTEVRRSSGRGFLISALVTAIAAAFTFFIATQIGVQRYGEPDYAAIATRWWWMVASSCFGSFAGLLFCVGSIIRAMWFLPGAETKRIENLAD